MKEKYLKLNIYYRVALWTFLISLFLFLLLIELFFIKIGDKTWGEVPLGILVGGSLGALLHLLEAIFTKRETSKETSSYSIFVIILRFVLFAGLMIGNAFLYYKAKIEIFNLFAIVGGYTVSVVTLVVFIARNKDLK